MLLMVTVANVMNSSLRSIVLGDRDIQRSVCQSGTRCIQQGNTHQQIQWAGCRKHILCKFLMQPATSWLTVPFAGQFVSDGCTTGVQVALGSNSLLTVHCDDIEHSDLQVA